MGRVNKMTYRLRKCCFMRFLSSTFALALCLVISPAFAQTNTFRLGVVGPFTGPSADFGMPMLQGIQLAVEEINAVGGYLGRPLELVIKDDKANPDEGLKQSQALIAEKVSMVIGFCNTGVAAKSLDAFQAAQMPLLIPCATGTPLTTKFPAADSFIFRNSARDAIQAPFVVEDIVKRGWTKVAICCALCYWCQRFNY
jgi:branched-chain amino acid transport system substrate-binding protein